MLRNYNTVSTIKASYLEAGAVPDLRFAPLEYRHTVIASVPSDELSAAAALRYAIQFLASV